MKKVIVSSDAPAPIGPYSQAIQAGGFLFVSGQIALDPVSGVMKNESVLSETKQVMENMKAIVLAANTSLENVVKCSIFVKDMNDFAAINELYGTYFAAAPPARETVEVARLPKDARVEISCIAMI